MNSIVRYTVFSFDYGIYHKNKRKLKGIMSKYMLQWRYDKHILLTPEQVEKSYTFFNVDFYEELKGRGGSSGVWANKYDAVKMISIDKVDDGEHLPALIIIKTSGEGETQFYKDFISYCCEIEGCEILRFEEDEVGNFNEVFRKKVNVELIKMLNNKEAVKKVKVDNFIRRIEILKEFGHHYSDSFINKWIECINIYTDGRKVLENKIEDGESVKIVKS